MVFTYTKNALQNDCSAICNALKNGEVRQAITTMGAIGNSFMRQSAKRVMEYVVDKADNGELMLTQEERYRQFLHLRQLAPSGALRGERAVDVPWTCSKALQLGAKDVATWVKNNPGSTIGAAVAIAFAPAKVLIAAGVGGCLYVAYKILD